VQGSDPSPRAEQTRIRQGAAMFTTATFRPPRLRPLRRTLFAAGLGLLALQGPAWATPDWTTVAPTCTPDLQTNSTFGLTSPSGGYVKAGRNPPKQTYMCPVWNADDLTTDASASWRRLQLQYLDITGGNVNAKLYAKNRSTGKVSLVASVTSAAAASINVASVPLRTALDFAVNGYYVVFELKASTGATPHQAHMVMLTN
jgi:hypothetical protein